MEAAALLRLGPSAPAPALRRGALVAVPVGVLLLLELGLEQESRGAIATAALLAGFTGFDAPALARAGWQAAVAPLIGLAAALGALTGSSALLAVATMAVVAAAAGYCVAVSVRFAFAGLTVALSLLLTQGLPVSPQDAPEALLYGTLGGLAQAGFSIAVFVVADRTREGPEEAWSASRARLALSSNLGLASVEFRHAIRFGATLAAGVAAYWAIGMEEHGFWIPLTILFVLRPDRGQTFDRLVLRAAGTFAGLVLATALSEVLFGHEIATALVLTVAAALSFGLVTVQYALFTTAVTTYVVLLADTLGEPALAAAGQRALATAIGIAIAGVAFVLWPNPAPGSIPRSLAGDRQSR